MSDTEISLDAVDNQQAANVSSTTHLTGADALTAKMFEAHARGDRETAKRINDQLVGNPNSELPPPLTEGETIESLPVERVNDAIEQLHELGPQGEALAVEWGSDVPSNFGAAKYAIDSMGSSARAAIDDAFRNADEAGKVALIKMGAQVGLLLAYRQGEEITPIAGSRKAMPVDLSELEAATHRIDGGHRDGDSIAHADRLTKAMMNAFARGDRDEANALGRQAMAMRSRIYGNEPIVGRGGKYA